MEKTLNDYVEGVFRSIVFVLFSFILSLGVLFWSPSKGYALLITQERRHSINQIRPYAFVFFALVLALFLPSLIDAAKPREVSTFEYQVYDPEHPEAGALGRAYEVANERIENKAAGAILIAAIAGIAALHLGTTASALGFFRLSTRRETWHDALFFIGGLQIFLIAIALALDRFASFPSLNEVEFLRRFLFTPFALLTSEDYREGLVYFDIINVVLLATFLVAPLAIAKRFSQRSDRQFWARYLRTVLPVLALLAVVDTATVTSIAIASYVADEIQPRTSRDDPFTLRNLGCVFSKDTAKPSISGTVEVRVAAANPWSFDNGDFTLIIGADRTLSDGPPRKNSRHPDRVFANLATPITFSAISPPLGAPPFLMQAGQAALLSIATSLKPDEVEFVAAHPEPRCTLAYLQDYPIGAIGEIRVEKQ